MLKWRLKQFSLIQKKVINSLKNEKLLYHTIMHLKFRQCKSTDKNIFAIKVLVKAWENMFLFMFLVEHAVVGRYIYCAICEVQEVTGTWGFVTFHTGDKGKFNLSALDLRVICFEKWLTLHKTVLAPFY